ncbi:MAG: caspase family protein [Bacteroidales bacterium]|nr:caspase family protein [Bacteroidales bacterium]
MKMQRILPLQNSNNSKCNMDMFIKKALLFLAIVAITIPVLVAGQTYAVIVGINQYSSSQVQNLQCTVNDAVAFSNYLKSENGGSVPAGNIYLLTNNQATRSNILSAMDKAFGRATDADRIIFFFSGHGFQDHFVAYDTDADDYYGVVRALSFSDVKAKFKSSKAKTKLIFADACFAGSFKTTSNATHPSTSTSFKDVQVAVMMSCKDDEVSRENKESLNHGVFTYYLLQGLKGGADEDGNGRIIMYEIFKYVHDHVSKYTSNNQTPVMYGNFDIRLIVGTY